ncbi:MAG: hypothetical protein R3264_22975, partial [Anaerolineae bacterium]|nr:hypothetical protein [Anaerolineae bacterium]
LIGFAQQSRPLPQTALPLLKSATSGPNTWLITIGFPPAASDNATEQWLTVNAFKATDTWIGNEVRLVRFSAAQPTTARPIGVTLGRDIRLVAVNFIPALQPAQTLPVELTWQPLNQPQTDYNLFLQLLTPAGTLVAQHDNPPGGGYAPTSSWQPGQQILDRHALVLPPDLQPNLYRLIAGLYDPQTGQRLPVSSTADFVELGTINIVQP